MGRIMKGLIRDGAARFEMTHVTREGMGIPVEISSRLLSLTDQKMVLSHSQGHYRAETGRGGAPEIGREIPGHL